VIRRKLSFMDFCSESAMRKSHHQLIPDRSNLKDRPASQSRVTPEIQDQISILPVKG